MSWIFRVLESRIHEQTKLAILFLLRNNQFGVVHCRLFLVLGVRVRLQDDLFEDDVVPWFESLVVDLALTVNHFLSDLRGHRIGWYIHRNVLFLRKNGRVFLADIQLLLGGVVVNVLAIFGISDGMVLWPGWLCLFGEFGLRQEWVFKFLVDLQELFLILQWFWQLLMLPLLLGHVFLLVRNWNILGRGHDLLGLAGPVLRAVLVVSELLIGGNIFGHLLIWIHCKCQYLCKRSYLVIILLSEYKIETG